MSTAVKHSTKVFARDQNLFKGDSKK